MPTPPEPDPAGSSTAARSFYEGYVEEHAPYHRSPRGWRGALLRRLPYWSYREWRFWDRWVPACADLLDLGCARGREVFRQKARRCIGVDLASTALADCARRYDGAALASLAALPFPDRSFDCVVSSHVLGHVPAALKPAVLGEIARVLRPGGRTVHVIETDSVRPLIVRAKREPQIYRRRLIDPDGHVGLELPQAALDRFTALGFEALAVEKMDARTLHPRLWVKWFDNEYRAIDPRVDRAVGRAQRTLRSPWRLAAAEIGLGAWHRTFGQWLPALDESLFVAAAFRSPPEGRGSAARG